MNEQHYITGRSKFVEQGRRFGSTKAKIVEKRRREKIVEGITTASTLWWRALNGKFVIKIHIKAPTHTT